MGLRIFDMDNDGWPDILICTGHVYPEVEQLKTEAGYPQRKLLYRNCATGRFLGCIDAGRPRNLSAGGVARIRLRRLRQRRRSRSRDSIR